VQRRRELAGVLLSWRAIACTGGTVCDVRTRSRARSAGPVVDPVTVTEHPVPVRAFIDESFRGTGDGRGIYLFAVVELTPEAESELRTELRRALPGRMRRFHWRDDSAAVRDRAAGVLASATAASYVLYRCEVDRRRQEQARQHALWNLVAGMRDRGTEEAVFEAREQRQNDKDQETLQAIAKARVGGSEFRFTFGRPLDEPLLWLPDTLAGMAGTTLVADGPHWFAEHYQRCCVDEVELPPLR
jgi:hypothetical protein